MKYLIILILFFSSISNSNAGILVPWNPVAKLNIGVDYLLKPSFSTYAHQTSDFTSDITKFQNSNIYAGVRIFRYFGIEAGYSRILSRFNQDNLYNDLSLKQQYFEGKLFIPLISLPSISIDGYLSYGNSKITASSLNLSSLDTQNSEIKNSVKYGYGVEAAIFGMASARLGTYVLKHKLDVMKDNKMHVTYCGLSIYLL